MHPFSTPGKKGCIENKKVKVIKRNWAHLRHILHNLIEFQKVSTVKSNHIANTKKFKQNTLQNIMPENSLRLPLPYQAI